jgi:hypothetical protein
MPDLRDPPKPPPKGAPKDAPPHLEVGRWKVRLPASMTLRSLIGAALILGGIFGWLPILGFWMIPLGLLVLSYEVPFIARWRDRLGDWWKRRKVKKQARAKKR